MLTSTHPTIKWPGISGRDYTYYIWPRGSTFDPGQAGNYIHAKETAPNTFVPIYIGQTRDLNQRLSNHEQQACVDRKGATHLHVHVTPGGEQARLQEEKDLIVRWQPPCNTQYCR